MYVRTSGVVMLRPDVMQAGLSVGNLYEDDGRRTNFPTTAIAVFQSQPHNTQILNSNQSIIFTFYCIRGVNLLVSNPEFKSINNIYISLYEGCKFISTIIICAQNAC